MSNEYRVRRVKDEGLILGEEAFEPLVLSTDPDVSNMAVDGSSADKIFQYVVPADLTFCWYRMTLKIIAASLVDLSLWDAAGRLAAADSPYVRVVNAADVEQQDFSTKTKLPLQGIVEMGLLAGVDLNVKTGVGADVALVRWTLKRGLGQPLLIPAGYKIQWVVRGDMSSLTEITSMLQGPLRLA